MGEKVRSMASQATLWGRAGRKRIVKTVARVKDVVKKGGKRLEKVWVGGAHGTTIHSKSDLAPGIQSGRNEDGELRQRN